MKDPEKERARKSAHYYLANRERLLARATEYRKTQNFAEVQGYQARYKKENREKLSVQNAGYYRRNRDARLEYYRKNREGVSARKTKRLREDPRFRLATNLRIRLCKALKRNSKSGSTFQLLGCTLSELRAHLGARFRPGMTWENYGPVWHVDHIRPCASFDLLDPVQQRECFNFKNLQPLFAEENLKKGAK